MNKILLIAGIATFLLFPDQEIYAQFRWNGAVEVGISQNQNLFRSPDTFLEAGRTLGPGNLYQNDRIIPLDVDAGIEYRSTVNRIELDYSGSMDIYETHAHLNGQFHAVRLRDTWSATKSVELEISVEGRKSKKVGTNALGDELSRIFEYVGAQSSFAVEWDLSKRYTLSVLYNFSHRDYTEAQGASSLDANTHKAALGWRYQTKKTKGAFWRVDAEAEYKLKSFISYRARDKNGQQFDFHPINKLHLFSTEIEVQRALSRKWTIELGIAGRYRYDFFEAYYSYGAAVLEFGVEWEPTRRFTLEGEVRARRTHFFGKVAPREGTADSPLLRYTYLMGEISLQYDVTPWISLETFVSTYNRHSNSNLETRLTRRSYETMEGGASLTFELEKMVRRR